MSKLSVLLALAVALTAVLHLANGRGGGISVVGPVVAHDRGWGLGGTTGMDARVGGTLGYDGGCLSLGGNPVVWPDGTGWDEEEQAVRLGDGTLVHLGDRVFGGGGMAQESPTRSETWSSTPTGRELARCLTEDNGVVVFNADQHLDVEPGDR